MNDRRDRHGRGVRGPLMPTKIPRYRRRPELFDAAVLEAYAPIQQQFAVELESLAAVKKTTVAEGNLFQRLNLMKLTLLAK